MVLIMCDLVVKGGESPLSLEFNAPLFSRHRRDYHLILSRSNCFALHAKTRECFLQHDLVVECFMLQTSDRDDKRPMIRHIGV